jgi:hypothetical protein
VKLKEYITRAKGKKKKERRRRKKKNCSVGENDNTE